MKLIKMLLGTITGKATGIPNRIENIGIIMIVLVILYFGKIKPMERQMIRQDARYEELAKIPKNYIKNTFEKIKTTKDGHVILDLDNQLYDLSPIEAEDTLISEPGKEGILKRLFKSNKQKNKKK